MIPLSDVVIMGLAVFRLASLLADERGPYNVFGRIRAKLGEYSLADGTRTANTEIGRGFICMYCLSVWIGALMFAGYMIDEYWTVMVCLPLALSGIAIWSRQ